MRAYLEYEKRLAITDTITYQKPITYDLLQQLRKDKRLENYDLFRVVDKDFDNMYIYYIEKEDRFYIIDISETTSRLVKEEHLQKEQYIIRTNLYENNVQDFIKRKSEKEFYELNERDRVQVILGKYIGLQIDECLSGLKKSLQDVIDALKEEKKAGD